MTDFATFRAGLLDADAPAPAGLTDGRGTPAGKRYDVYRNNVTFSLIAALKEAFPLVLKLIGAGNFDRMAPAYVRRHPPHTPLMMHYGAEFPAFLQSFEPLAHIGYLPDAARLDLAMRASYHAADEPALSARDFADMPPDALLGARFALAPATRMIRTAWPLWDIWRYNFVEGAAKPRAVSQDVLVTRPEYDPALHLLPKGAAEWLKALENGDSLEDAQDRALNAEPDFDLAESLGLALATGALAAPIYKGLK